MLGSRSVTTFAADVDLVELWIVVDVHVTGSVVDGADEELPGRLVLITLPSRQMTARAHGLHGVRVDRRRRQHIVCRAIALIRTGRPPHVELVVVPHPPLS